MIDKRSLIMATAKKLFIAQGIRGTTIAGIAEQAGIAKGSVYSYFDSKLSIVKGLLNEADELSREQVDDLLGDPTLQGGSLMRTHIKQQLEQAKIERAFQQALMNDDSWAVDQDILNFIQNSRVNYAKLQKTILLRVFGDELSPWVLDVSTILNGLLQEFSIYIMMDNAEFSHDHCADFINFSLVQVANGLIKTKPIPVLNEVDFPLNEQEQSRLKRQRAENLLEKMRQALPEIDQKNRALAHETLEMLNEQITSETDNLTLLRALIANLRPYDELKTLRAKLADIYDVELI
jgi:AcrR family transcriptional regulator